MKEPTIYFATPEKEFPSSNKPHDCFIYAYDNDGNEVRGMNLDAVVRLAVLKLNRIESVGKIGL